MEPAPPRAAEPTFGEFADQWFQGIAPTLSERTREDYLWALNAHLLPFFTEKLLSEITVQTVDEYRQASKLGPASVNKTLKRLAQILDLAIEYGHITANPARGRRRRAKATPRQRSYLEAEQVLAVLEAAGELDREATRYKQTGRRAVMSTLILAGLRVSELATLKWGDLDLINRKLYVRDSKTGAGVRAVPISDFLHDELVAYKDQAVESKDQAVESPLVFPTGTGQQRDKDNIRNRIHNPVIKRVNENLAKQGRLLIQPGLTNAARSPPHVH